jgi:hypothetical protein
MRVLIWATKRLNRSNIFREARKTVQTASRNFAKPFRQFFSVEEISNRRKNGFLPVKKFREAGKTNFLQRRNFLKQEKSSKTPIEISRGEKDV